MSQQSRRDFLKFSSFSAAGLSLGGAFFVGRPRAHAEPQSGRIGVWITDDNQRLARGPSISWRTSSVPNATDVIVLRPDEAFQEILGFGAAFTDAACYTLNGLDPSPRTELLHELFHPSELGLSVCRTCIGSSDYSTKLYSYDESGLDPELKNFSIDPDREYILPILREARKVNPDLFLFSSPWSPPGWMKPNGSMLGGNMERKYMPSYANYFLKFLQAYEAEGVPVQAITVQNEVDTDQDGRMPACIWPQEYEADFVRFHLGPLFERSGLRTKIWLIDHNYNLWGRAIGELETPDVRKYANAIAWHGYVGKPEWIQRVQSECPDVEMYWTEGGPDLGDPNYEKNWTDWSTSFTEILCNGCRSITGWNFALDENGNPNIGPFHCAGLVTINSRTKQITRSGQYWALAHFSRFVKRGARRFHSEGAIGLRHAAFENKDGKRVVTITNSGPDRVAELRNGQEFASISIGRNSVITLEWPTDD